MIQVLPLANECYSTKLELLTNAWVVDYAIRFVSQKPQENLKSSANDNEHNKESNESGYDDNEDQ